MSADWTPLDIESGTTYTSGESGVYIKKVLGQREDLWEVFIPPTRIEHFDGYEVGDTATTAELHDASIEAPWGATYWPTLPEAAAFLQGCIEAGQVVPRQEATDAEGLTLMSEMECEWKRQRDEWLKGQPREVVAIAYVWFKSGWQSAARTDERGKQ